uniref:Uncharacterized protein n=1 Tax=Poecilia latipinna TaxID=48699 RepID=A0A3B3TN50_9TELE
MVSINREDMQRFIDMENWQQIGQRVRLTRRLLVLLESGYKSSSQNQNQASSADGAQTPFSVGRGLNFNMAEQAPGRQMGGGASGVGMGGMEGLDGGGGQMTRRGGGGDGPLGRHMKLFSSLGLSPSDLDALAQIPDEDITMETLPRILMQLKSRKGAAGERGAAASEAAFRGGRDGWDPSPGQARNQSSGDFGFGSMRDGYGSGSGSGSGYGMGVSSDPLFMQRRMGAPSSGKIQDFLGVAPPMYPHVCSLCDFDVHSSMVSTPTASLTVNV